MRSNPPGIAPAGTDDSGHPAPSPSPASARAEPNGAALDAPAIARSRREREDWIHEFRNALGNITIAASAAKGELAELQYPQASALMRQIEEGCDRCLNLLRTMPR